MPFATPCHPRSERRPLDALGRETLVTHNREPILMLHLKLRLGFAKRMMKTVVIALAIPRPKCVGVHRCERDVAMRVIRVAMDGKDAGVSVPSSSIERVFRSANELLVGNRLAFFCVEGDHVVLDGLLHARLCSHDRFNVERRRLERRHPACVDGAWPRATACGRPDDSYAKIETLTRLGVQRSEPAPLPKRKRIVAFACVFDFVRELFAEDVFNCGRCRAATTRRRTSLPLQTLARYRLDVYDIVP